MEPAPEAARARACENQVIQSGARCVEEPVAADPARTLAASDRIGAETPVFAHSRRTRPANLRNLADEELMELVESRGDARAFGVVFERHADAAFSLAYRMCGRRAQAEDVVQDAFLSLWRSASQFDPARGSVRAWVLRATHNRAIDAFRRSAGKDARDVADEGLADRVQARERTEEEVERREDARQVRSALDGLPSDQRQVIELAYFGGFTHTQIAEMLALPAGTVKGRMRLGMSKMRIALDEGSGVSA